MHDMRYLASAHRRLLKRHARPAIRDSAAGLIVALLAVAAPARADLMLNEISVRGLPAVELYNNGSLPVDLIDFRLDINGILLPLVGIVPPGGLLVPTGANSMPGEGGAVALREYPSGIAVDSIAYGFLGGVPTPPLGFPIQPTIARWKDGVSTGDPARDWTIDFTPSLGLPNEAPEPALGRDVVLNEIQGIDLGDPDSLELMNRLGRAIDLTGWQVVHGGSRFTLSGSIEAIDRRVFTLPFAAHPGEAWYLFDRAGVRVDQLGTLGEPAHDPTLCVSRSPDGAGPNDGYDWTSSGGGVTLLRTTCTLYPPTASEPATWGSLRLLYR